MTQKQRFIHCNQVHPNTGDVCTLDVDHVQHDDARVKQHTATNGVKWPSLMEIDPAEGWVGPQPFRV